MWKSSFYSRWLWESQAVYSALPPPRIRPCEMDVSGKHVPVLKDVTSEWRQISRSFLSGCMWRRTEWLQWSSEDLKRQRILCLPLRLKPWRPSPRAGQLELMPRAGANSQYKQQCLLLTQAHSLPVSHGGWSTPRQPGTSDPLPCFGSESLDLLYRSHYLKGEADVSALTKQSLWGSCYS